MKQKLLLEENETRNFTWPSLCILYQKYSFGDKVLGGGWITKTINNYFIHIINSFKL